MPEKYQSFPTILYFIYSETEMDLGNHSCIVNMQNVTLFLCVRVYGCHATHILHSSNKHFQKQFCLTIK